MLQNTYDNDKDIAFNINHLAIRHTSNQCLMFGSFVSMYFFTSKRRSVVRSVIYVR